MMRRISLVQSLVLALILGLGGSVAWAIVVGWSLVIGMQAAAAGRVHEALYVTLDGKPQIQRYSGRNLEQMQNLDLEGNLVDRNPQDPFLRGASFAALRPNVAGWEPDVSPRIAAFNDGGQPAVYWYLVSDEDAVFFVGYHSLTRLCVGYLGVDGFRDQRPGRSEMFPMDVENLGNAGVYGAISSAYVTSDEPQYALGYTGPNRIPGWMVYMVSGRRLLEVDLKERSVRLVLESDGLLSVGLAEEVQAAVEASSPQRQNLLVRTYDELWVVDAREGRRKSYSLPAEVGRSGFLTVYQTGEEGLLVFQQSNVGAATDENGLYWLDASGQVVRRQQVRLQTGVQVALPSQALVALTVPSPLGLMFGASVLIPLEHLQSGEESTYRGALSRSLADWWPAIFALFAISAGLAFLAYRRHRQYELPGAIAWALFILALGPLGFMAYLYHRAWPPCLACAHCGQVCPHDREACTECQTPFPLPKRKGIEVFA